jgi:hypothetical protein
MLSFSIVVDDGLVDGERNLNGRIQLSTGPSGAPPHITVGVLDRQPTKGSTRSR